jgi:HEAT repeat protein
VIPVVSSLADATWGSFRLVPVKALRQIVDERSANKDYNHRLTDYNNDASTRLDDVRSLFAEALKRMGPASQRPRNQ